MSHTARNDILIYHNAMKKILFLLFLFVCVFRIEGQDNIYNEPAKVYKLWYNAPAPNTGIILPPGESDRPLDLDWENWSLPIGNSYMGACIFGRTDTERLQITDKTLYIKGLWGAETQTSFADLYIDFHHSIRSNYQRGLILNNAVAYVNYDCNGVHYEREYFMSYPDKVLVIRLKAGKPGKLSFTIRPEIPYLTPFGPLQRTDSVTKGYLSGHTTTRHSYNGRTGKVTAQDDLITLRGETEYLKLIYEGQIKVIPSGGSMQATNNKEGDHGTISVENADSALILFTLGTNYQLENQTFEKKPAEKLTGNPDPHKSVMKTLTNAASKSYEELLAKHQADYKNLFNRASLNLTKKESDLPTDRLLSDYKEGKYSGYLEELFFQYGRYLLISTSRKGTLPPTLQGVWNQYELAPWNGNYTHNINIQMNYWPAFNTNLIDLFECYADYHKAYKKTAEKMADRYIHIWKPSLYSPEGNGWTMGTGATAYSVSMPGGHSGPGMSALTSKLFWEYYAFTSDKKILKETTYPTLSGVATFLSKSVCDTLGYLLAYPSSSPEQYSKATNKPYPTVGCAFDQQMMYENHHDVLTAAKLLKEKKSAALSLYKQQIQRLDPVQIGASGQIKEYREETFYGDIVLEPHHRHISHLMGLFPGTLINENTPAWLDAAKVTLNSRGDTNTGWSMAHKINLWARAKEGERAYQLLQSLLKTATLNNLWTNCIAVLRSPYQIDANFGGTAGIAEMLLQSHEGYIHLLPALPSNWETGSYRGLTARGNFEISARWKKGQAEEFHVLSKKGNECILKYPLISHAVLTDIQGKRIKFKILDTNRISFRTHPGEKYTIKQIPDHYYPASPTEATAFYQSGNQISVQWKGSPKAVSYSLYHTVGNQPDYQLITSELKDTQYTYFTDNQETNRYITFKIIAVGENGEKSKGITIHTGR